MPFIQPFTRLNPETKAHECLCHKCGYLSVDKFWPGNVQIQKATCIKCHTEKQDERYKERTVLDRLRHNVRVRLNKAGHGDLSKGVTTDFIYDVLHLNGIKVNRSTRSTDWEYKDLKVYPSRSLDDIRKPECWHVIVLDNYLPAKKKQRTNLTIPAR